MFLNHEQIKEKNIIENFSEDEFMDGSYNLTIDRIIDMKGKVIGKTDSLLNKIIEKKNKLISNVLDNPYKLKPQGMAYVIFKEKLNLPSNIIGFAHVKTTLTKRGIMATNIGIIDSNYNGYISTLLINFGKSPCNLKPGMAALRVTFSSIEEPEKRIDIKQNNVTLDKYTDETQKNINFLDDKFLNLNAVEAGVKKAVLSHILTLGIIFTAGGFIISSIFQYKNSKEKDLDRAIRKYETELSIISENNRLLQEQLKTYEFKLSALEDIINLQKKELKEKAK